MRVAIAVFVLLAVATVGAFLAFIWTGDERWAQTGAAGVALTIVAGGAVGIMAEIDGY